MADNKFAGLRAVRPTPPHTESEPIQPQGMPATEHAHREPVIEAPREKGRGRPPGKRSNPDWKLYSHFLKKRTQREAAAILQAEDEARDLSDVLQELLEQWITSRKPS